jgi:aryl-alcohol dehydrogenase-like predicted oxidoreductase
VQNRLNPFFREAIETGIVDACAERQLTFLAYSPVGGGRLTRKIPDIPALRRIGETRGVSPHAVVLAWVRSQGRNVVAIPAASRVASALDSAASAELELTAEELEQIDRTNFSRD